MAANPPPTATMLASATEFPTERSTSLQVSPSAECQTTKPLRSSSFAKSFPTAANPPAPAATE
jgi:hypothetical protein